jgi:hypothetical protein
VSKIITSPVAEFPGTITLIDRVTLPILAEYTESDVKRRMKVSSVGENETAFEAMCTLCERWNIEGQPEHPTGPSFVIPPGGADATRSFLQWLKYEIDTYIGTATTIPKFLRAASTTTQETAPVPNQPS